jgi:VanZ family protein
MVPSPLADDPPPSARHQERLAVRVRVLAGVYVALMFVATHTPPPPTAVPSYNDKLAHFGAYGLLATAVLAAWDLKLRGLSLRHYLLVGLACLLYGLFDEVSQVLVGRSCEALDWVADATGVTAALLCYALLRTRLYRWSRGASTAAIESRPCL